jgi:hypothetical protein
MTPNQGRGERKSHGENGIEKASTLAPEPAARTGEALGGPQDAEGMKAKVGGAVCRVKMTAASSGLEDNMKAVVLVVEIA